MSEMKWRPAAFCSPRASAVRRKLWNAISIFGGGRSAIMRRIKRQEDNAGDVRCLCARLMSAEHSPASQECIARSFSLGVAG